MSGPFMLSVPMMFWVRLRLRRSANICRLVRIDVQHLLHLCASVDDMLGSETEFLNQACTGCKPAYLVS